MKKYILTLLLAIPFSLTAYTWVPLGPAGVHANDIIFNVGSNYSIVICANDGLYISDTGANWDFYTTYGLPVRGAVPYNDTSFIFVMGAGSFSDGIYLFSLNTMQYSVLDWLYIPEFIYQSDYDDYFYVGYYAGLRFSDDGISWTDISYFTGKKCVWMDSNYSNYLVSQNDTAHDLHYSGDAGKKWSPTSCPYIITDFRYKCTGELYGVFPGFSNSSGLYSSGDYGLSWTLETYSDNMSTVGYDATTNIFTGWESTAGANEGVAIFNPVTKVFDFVNIGLPNKNINKFRYNPLMSSISNFACTDNGVYMIHSYIVDIEEQIAKNNYISVFPNPFNHETTIEINSSLNDQNIEIEVYSSDGELVRKLNKKGKNQVIFNRDGLKSGIYFLRLNYGGNIQKRKVVIR